MLLNTFHANIPFLYRLKISVHQRFLGGMEIEHCLEMVKSIFAKIFILAAFQG